MMFKYLAPSKNRHLHIMGFFVLVLISVAGLANQLRVWSYSFRIAAGDNGSRPLLIAGAPMINSVGIEIRNTGDDNLNASFILEYKKSSDSTWKTAYTPQRSYNRSLGGVNYTYYYGSLMFLNPSTAYNYRATVTDPDGGTGTVVSGGTTTKSDTISVSTIRTLYVSISGNDANTGTDPGQPLRTIQRAADISQAGDNILIQPGTYQENIVITRSGTANNPIIFESAQVNNQANIEGGESALAVVDEIDNWLPDDHSPANSGVYYTTLSSWVANSENPIYVAAGTEKIYAYWYYPYDAATQTFDNFINGLYCSMNCTAGCCPSGVSGGYWYDTANKKLYVRLPDNTDPDDVSMHVVKRNSFGVRLNNVNNVIIRGLDIAYNHVGIRLTGSTIGSHDNVIEKNITHHNNTGIGLGENTINGASVYQNLIQDNLIYDSKTSEWPWDAVKLNDVEGDGINLSAGRENIIRRNTIHDVFNGIMMGIYWSENDESYNKNADINDNIIYDIGDDAIEPEGADVNIRIFNNRIYRSIRSIGAQSGISIAPITKGPIWIVRNTFSDIKQTAFKVSVNESVPVGQALIFHNTVYGSLGDFMALFRIWSPTNGIKATLRNNAFLASGVESAGNGDAYIFEDITSSHSNPAITLDMDYDSLFTNRSSACGSACRFAVWLGSAYSSLNQFTSASGQESHGVSIDPLFGNASGNNFNLTSASPLVDKGIVLGGINDDFMGTGPDIGAIESSYINCTENWTCGDWSTCTSNSQTRTCTDAASCGTTVNRPALSQSCVSVCTPNWTCGDWSACISNSQARTCADANNCGTTSGQPALQQSCTVNPACTPNWTCGNWSVCASNSQARTCADANNCGTTSGQPAQTQSCSITCTPSWTCASWSTCSNNQQSRTCGDTNSCGVITGRPTLTQSCGTTADHPDTGTLLALQGVKGTAVYFVANNGKKYVYPDSQTYFTWYGNFNKIKKVATSKLDTYPDGGSVPNRAGLRLLTHVDTNKIYAVEPGATLRHLPSENVAKNLYGNSWTNLVQYVIPGFFSTSYNIGSPLSTALPSGSLLKYNNEYYLILGTSKRKFASISALKLNNFNPNNAIDVGSLSAYQAGWNIISFEKAIATFRPNVTETEMLGKDPSSLGDMTDTDRDGLTNFEETNVWLTKVSNPDSDGDGYSDGAEVKNGYNPIGSGTINIWIEKL